jgi:hypothetical protein
MSSLESTLLQELKRGKYKQPSGRNENQFKILIKTRMIREEINERPSLLYLSLTVLRRSKQYSP